MLDAFKKTLKHIVLYTTNSWPIFHRHLKVTVDYTGQILTEFQDLAYLWHQGNINEDISMKNKYTFPILENFENK